MTPAHRVLDLAMGRPPRCAGVRVVLVDGPAGSGKTTLAGAVARAAAERGVSAAVVHMDDLYAGWHGLRAGGDVATAMLRSIAAGEPGRYRRYDWEAERYAETVTLPEVGMLVVEGVGSARSGHLDLACVLVWVEEPEAEERLRRGLDRDGPAAEPHWRRWMAEEELLFAEVGARSRADLVVDGVGRLVEAST